jgi:hypothetical protein
MPSKNVIPSRRPRVTSSLGALLSEEGQRVSQATNLAATVLRDGMYHAVIAVQSLLAVLTAPLSSLVIKEHSHCLRRRGKRIRQAIQLAAAELCDGMSEDVPFDPWQMCCYGNSIAIIIQKF